MKTETLEEFLKRGGKIKRLLPEQKKPPKRSIGKTLPNGFDESEQQQIRVRGRVG